MASILKNYDNLLPSEIEEKSLEAREWFKDNLRNIKVNRNKLLVEGTPIRTPFLGTLVLFNYNAKGYATLPYWDKYPVVIPIEPRGKGFLGLNLHYLPPRKRLELLEVFDQLAVDPDMGDDENTRLKLTYDMVKSISKLKWARPCVKEYLTTHIKGQIREIPYDYWDVVAMLPSQKFVDNQGSAFNANTVYAESLKRVI